MQENYILVKINVLIHVQIELLQIVRIMNVLTVSLHVFPVLPILHKLVQLVYLNYSLAIIVASKVVVNHNMLKNKYVSHAMKLVLAVLVPLTLNV